jgi:hypothetical protein
MPTSFELKLCFPAVHDYSLGLVGSNRTTEILRTGAGGDPDDTTYGLFALVKTGAAVIRRPMLFASK